MVEEIQAALTFWLPQRNCTVTGVSAAYSTNLTENWVCEVEIVAPYPVADLNSMAEVFIQGNAFLFFFFLIFSSILSLMTYCVT